MEARLRQCISALPRSGAAAGTRAQQNGAVDDDDSLAIDAGDPNRLAGFWSKVLGYVELGGEDDGSIEIGLADAGFGGPQPTLILRLNSAPRTGKLRLHIDVNATDRD